jgi:hypothetical protein
MLRNREMALELFDKASLDFNVSLMTWAEDSLISGSADLTP